MLATLNFVFYVLRHFVDAIALKGGEIREGKNMLVSRRMTDRSNEPSENPVGQEPVNMEVWSQASASAQYSNTVRVNVTDDAVIFQFLYVRPGTQQGVLLSEIALSPQHAMRLAQTIDKTVKHHFTRHLEL